MNKAEIINELLQGKEVTHESFKDESILRLNKGYILNRKGNSMVASDFWDSISGIEEFEEGWSVVSNEEQ